MTQISISHGPITLLINDVLEVVSPAPPVGTRNIPYSHAFQVNGGIAPYTYVLESGTLPLGLVLSSSGVLAGTPAEAGTFNNVVIKITDSGII